MPSTVDHIQAAQNRLQLHELLRKHRLSQAGAAAVLSAVSGRPCSVRAVMSWLADPKRSSARPCPTWAVEMLQKAIAQRHPSVAQAKKLKAGRPNAIEL